MTDVEVTVAHDKALRMVATARQHTWAIDSADSTDTGPSPMEALLGALGACALMDVVIVFDKRKVQRTIARIRLEGDRAKDPPRRFTAIRMVFESDAPADETRRAAQLSMEKYCSVASTLLKGAPVSWDVRLSENA